MTIYQVYDRVAHYLSNPINVVIDETEQKNGSTPAIVVCPSGQFRPYLNELVMFQTHFLQDMVDIVLQRDDKSAYFAENNISLTDEDINSLISKLTDLVSSVDQSNDTELTNIRAQLNAISTSLADKLPITSSLLRMEEPTPNGIISLPHFTGDFSSMLFTDYRNRNKPYSTDPCLTFSSDYVWNESIARIIKCRLAGRSNLKNPKEINEGLIGYLKHISQYPTFIGGVRAKSEDIIIDCKWLGGKCNVTDVWTPQGKCFRISPLTENWIFKDVGSKYSVNILIDTLNNELLNQQTKIYYYSGNETEFALVSGGIDIRPGKTSDISINQIRRQIRAAKNCGSLKLKHFDTYSNEKCVWEMRTEKIAEECQCLSDHTPQYWTEMQKVTLENTYQPALNFCSFARSVFCTRKAQEVEYFCPESCEESVYEMDMSVMPIDEKKVFVRIPRDFDKKVALITDNFAFQGGFQAAPGSEQLDLLLNEIFGALMNLLSLFWRKEADPYYRVVFGQDIVNKWTESGSFGKYFLTGNRSSLPCSQFSPS
uniref:Uncharacterized protein n=1 Tax=Plectus sambesii TaxID=2011161 RepID=A0A914VZU6_9BILA